MAKRGNGEGSIYYRESRHAWCGQITLGVDTNGKPIRKVVYGKTRKIVAEKLLEMKINPPKEKSQITIGQLGKEIIQIKFDANIISPNTYHRNLLTFKHIDEAIGDIPIQQITPEEIQKMLNGKINYSPSTIEKITEMLNALFLEAIKRDIISKSPMSLVVRPKSNKRTREVDALTVEEQKTFVEYAQFDTYKNVILLAIHTGMRIGEILALKHTDIVDDYIHIERTLTKDEHGKVCIGITTKTYDGVRTIPITKLVRPIIDEAIKESIPNENNLIFTLDNGGIITPSTINTHVKRIAKNAKIRDYKKSTHRLRNGIHKYYNESYSSVTTHMLRHTYATRCIEAGVPAEVLQRLLGHKDISITINTYTTIFDKFKKDSLDDYIKYMNKI